MAFAPTEPTFAPTARRIVLDVLDSALRRVDGRATVAACLHQHDAFKAARRVSIIAIGKAAAAMTLGALDECGSRLSRALVVTKDGHGDVLRHNTNITLMEAGHPLPDMRSLRAGNAVLQRAAQLEPDEFALLLISGGASSLAEVLRPGVTLVELTELNRRGLACAWSIERLNTERAKLSELKGGGLSRAIRGRPGLVLFISDVPGDDPAVIGSGLAGPDPAHGDSIERCVVASLDAALDAADAAAHAHGLECAVRWQRFDGTAEHVAADFCAALRGTDHEVLAWGGESVVRLPPQPGRGGRNQHLALAAAFHLRDMPATYVLAAGTDGSDGVTNDAGALVDSSTLERIEIAGFDPQLALERADSGTVLEAAGDLVHTGPTGTNVCDLLIGLRYGSLGTAHHGSR